jgi:hypothetical protein
MDSDMEEEKLKYSRPYRACVMYKESLCVLGEGHHVSAFIRPGEDSKFWEEKKLEMKEAKTVYAPGDRRKSSTLYWGDNIGFFNLS